MKRTLAVAAAVLLAAAVAGVAFTSGAAAESHRIDSCTVLDEPGHYELAGDVQAGGNGTCIEVRTSDVVVDGKGHAVEGPGPADDTGDDGSVGVAVDETSDGDHENVTLRNVEVTGFDTGVQIGLAGFGGPTATLEDVAVRGNHDGVVHVGANLTLSNVTVENNTDRGYWTLEAGRTDGTDVTIRENGAGLSATEAAVSLESSILADNADHGASVGSFVPLELTDVEVTGNGDQGIAVTGSGASVTMHGGTVTDNAGPGVTVRGDAEADLADVTVAGNGEDGIRTLDGPITISNVTATDNADLELNGVEGEVSAGEFHVGGSATTGFDEESVGLGPVDREALPERDDGSAAGDGLNVSGDVEGQIELELDVDTDDETVDLWRHDGSGWETVAEDLDATDGTVEAAVDRNGTYAPGTDADEQDGGDGTDGVDGTEDGDETDGTDDGDEEPSPTPSDQDGEKDKAEATPTTTPSDQNGEKDKETPTATPDDSSDCGCPSSDDDTGDDDSSSTEADSPTATADGAVTASPSSDEQHADDDDGTDASGDAVAQADDEEDTAGDGAGPGPVVALLAVVGTALLARRLE